MPRTVNSDLLVLAREARGITQHQLAAAANLPQSSVSKYEHGLLEPGPERLGAIAHALDLPVSFFSWPEQVYGFGTPCLYHRKRQSVPAHRLRQIHARMNLLRMQISRMLRGVEIEPVTYFDRRDIDEHDSPEAIAALVRAGWRLPLGPIANLIAAIESAGGIVVRLPFGTRKLDAVSHWAPGMPPLFLVNGELTADRLRFTLAHEIGHVIMHTRPSDSQEQEADRFAAELLMPAHEILRDLDGLTLARAVQLKPYWKVSIAALVRRAYDLRAISQSRYRGLMAELSRLGFRLAEPAPIADEHPRVLQQIVELHQREHGYTVAELSELVGLHEPEFTAQYLAGRPQLRLVG